MAKEAQSLVTEFNTQEIANSAWAFARLGQLDDKLFEALSKETKLRVSEFKAQEIVNTA